MIPPTWVVPAVGRGCRIGMDAEGPIGSSGGTWWVGV